MGSSTKPMLNRVIALDPGITTGIAIGEIDPSGYMRVKCEQLQLDHLALYDMLTANMFNHLVCETFEFRKPGRQTQGANLYPVELIGVVYLVMQQCKYEENPPQLHMQSPAKGKGYFTDDKLREAQVYVAGKQHGRDAMRHLLQWYQFGFGYQFNKKGFGP